MFTTEPQSSQRFDMQQDTLRPKEKHRLKQTWTALSGKNELVHFFHTGLSICPNVLSLGPPLCGSFKLCEVFLCVLCASVVENSSVLLRRTRINPIAAKCDDERDESNQTEYLQVQPWPPCPTGSGLLADWGLPAMRGRKARRAGLAIGQKRNAYSVLSVSQR